MKRFFGESFQAARRVFWVNRILQILLCVTFLFGVNYLASSHFWHYSLGYSFYALSPETLAYLEQLSGPVEIYAFSSARDSEASAQIHEDVNSLVREYVFASKAAGKDLIHFERIDVFRDRRRMRELASELGPIQENTIIVRSGKRIQTISGEELYSEKGGELKAFRGENVLSAAILDVTMGEPQRIYFLESHGEMRPDDVHPVRGLSLLADALRQRNFLVETLNLKGNQSLPQDARLLVIAAPQVPFTPEEVLALKDYMARPDSHLLVFTEPFRPHGLDMLLEEWGLRTADYLIVDASEHTQSTGGQLLVRHFTEHPMNQFLIDYQLGLLLGPSGPVLFDWGADEDPNRVVTPIFASSPDSWARRFYGAVESRKDFDPSHDIEGPVTIAMLSEKRFGEYFGMAGRGGSLLLIGNADLVSNQMFGALGNRIFIMNAIYSMAGRNHFLNIPPKVIPKYQLNMSKAEFWSLLRYFTAVPVLVGSIGVVVCWRRRRA